MARTEPPSHCRYDLLVWDDGSSDRCVHEGPMSEVLGCLEAMRGSSAFGDYDDETWSDLCERVQAPRQDLVFWEGPVVLVRRGDA
jgi:hypothetical protein